MPDKKNETGNTDRQIADLILQIGRATYADCASDGLTQAQWIGLRFFSRANRFSRNVSGFAEFHGTTRGTASQTVKSLMKRGYLVRTRSEKDARCVRFDLTPAARDLLSDDPLENLVEAAKKLSGAKQARTASCLRELMINVARNGNGPMTGVCALCGHLDAREKGAFGCRLMRESLIVEELDELCVRFQPAA
jgi:DNA-binding MarR family transcriptional regulator